MALPYMYSYSWTSSNGLAAGAEHRWVFGPWYWPGRSIAVSAHPLHYSGDPPPYDYDLRLEVTHVWERRTADPNAFNLYCSVRNRGPDRVKNYQVVIGGVKASSNIP